MFANVDVEGVRLPASDFLDEGGWVPGLGKSRCAARAQGVTGDIVLEVHFESSKEPAAGWNAPIGTQPEFGMIGEKGIAGSNVALERRYGIVTSIGSRNEDVVTLEKVIGFVPG